eukprot:15481155-Alexandrium_andersonii.AAC.1
MKCAFFFCFFHCPSDAPSSIRSAAIGGRRPFRSSARGHARAASPAPRSPTEGFERKNSNSKAAQASSSVGYIRRRRECARAKTDPPTRASHTCAAPSETTARGEGY